MEEKPQYLKITSDVDRMIQRRRDKAASPRATEAPAVRHHEPDATERHHVELTDTQRKVLDTIIERTEATGKPPTFLETAEVLGLAKVTVRKAVDVLEDTGHVVRCTFYPLRGVDGSPLK